MQNIKIGLVASSVPVAVKSRVPLRFPSWNTQTIAPNVADRLSRLRITALMGITTDPNCRNSTAKVTRAMIAAASRSEEHPSELQTLMRSSYASLCLKKKTTDRKYYHP